MDGQVFISYSSADKLIADAVCHRLEEAGIPCWIAPRDIKTSDWAGSIMDGLRRSKIYVVIISHNSIASPEVTKEVTEATRVCDYLLPFKVDTEELSDRLRYHLGPCHWLDAVNPPLEKRIDELIERIRNLSREDAVYQNTERMRLVEKMVSPRGLFVGREEEIETLASLFKQEHVVFLQGMGGIGKSEIAKGYARDRHGDYDTVVFAGYTSGLKDLICGGDVLIENLNRADGETQDLWFCRKMEALRSLTNERTLLIIDNFDVDEDPDMEEVFSIPAHILVTSRNDHTDYPTLSVGPIADFDTVRKIFTTHYGKPVKPEEQTAVDEMLRLVGCHTITVELIAKQMKASFLKPEKMLERLRSTGTNTHLKEKVKREGSTEKLTGFDYIRQLFSLSGLTEEEKHLLEVMSFMPVSGIEVSLLGEILDLEDFDAVNDLIGKSWLMLDEETEKLQLHPVVADVIREELKPSPLSCKDFVNGWFIPGANFWNKDMQERNRLYAVLLPLLIRHPVPERALFGRYVAFVNIMWMCSDFERSENLGHTVYQYALKEYGPASEEASRAALVLASAYHNMGDDISAEPWYKKTVEHYLAFGGRTENATLAMGYLKVARCARLRGDLDTAREYYTKSGEEYQYLLEHKIFPPKRIYPDQYYDYLMDLDRLKMAEGDYQSALEMATETNKLVVAEFGDGVASCVYTLTDMGECCSMLGRFDEADQHLQKALDINLRYNGKASLQTMQTQMAMVDNDVRRGDIEKGRSCLIEMELDAEKYFGPDNPLTCSIRKKREALES
jgi:tetratricopeptide (TPR) repeat protein